MSWSYLETTTGKHEDMVVSTRPAETSDVVSNVLSYSICIFTPGDWA